MAKDAKGHGSNKRGVAGQVREQARDAINRALALMPPKATAAEKVAQARAALKAALSIAPRGPGAHQNQVLATLSRFARDNKSAGKGPSAAAMVSKAAHVNQKIHGLGGHDPVNYADAGQHMDTLHRIAHHFFGFIGFLVATGGTVALVKYTFGI